MKLYVVTHANISTGTKFLFMDYKKNYSNKYGAKIIYEFKNAFKLIVRLILRFATCKKKFKNL